jgi:hypothetical protein
VKGRIIQLKTDGPDLRLIAPDEEGQFSTAEEIYFCNVLPGEPIDGENGFVFRKSLLGQTGLAELFSHLQSQGYQVRIDEGAKIALDETASGVMAMSSLSAPAAVSSDVSRTSERRARSMSSATRSNTMLPPIWNAGSVMPSSRKIQFPVAAQTIRTPPATQQASRAIRMRLAGESVGVIARNAGSVAIGSTMMNSELKARRMYA